LIKAGQAYDQRNEFEHRDDVERQLANKHDKRTDLILPFGKKLGFVGATGNEVVFGLDGSGVFSITVDDSTVFNLATSDDLTSLTFTVDSFVVSNGTTDEKPFEVSGGVVKIKTANVGVLVAANIDTGAVTASKISVSSLDAVSATVGLLRTASSGARMELESNVIRAYDSSGTLRARFGVWT